MHTLKRFIQYYAPYKKVFFLDLICAAVISLADLACYVYDPDRMQVLC